MMRRRSDITPGKISIDHKELYFFSPPKKSVDEQKISEDHQFSFTSENELTIAFGIPAADKCYMDLNVATGAISAFAQETLTYTVNFLWKSSGLTFADMSDLNQLRKDKLYKTEDLAIGVRHLNKLSLLKKEVKKTLVATQSIFPFSKMFDGADNSLNLKVPTSIHIKKMWEKIESDFSAAFHNDDHLNNDSAPLYFAHKNGSCSITQKGREIIKELGSYTVRHFILFTLWDFLSTYRSDTKKPQAEWDNLFPELFKSLVDSKELLEKKLFEQCEMRCVYFV